MGFGRRSCMLECSQLINLIATFFIGFRRYRGIYIGLFMAIEVKARGWDISRLEAATAITSFVIEA